GLPVQMTNYRFVDTGFQTVDVENFQSRFLAGLRGMWGGYQWESAVVYSEAEAEDHSPNINMTLLQQQLALSTPDAYNPFTGGCADTPTHSDCSPSSEAAVEAIVFDLVRKSRTTLAMADFRMNRPDLVAVPAGDVGIAFAVEARRATWRASRARRAPCPTAPSSARPVSRCGPATAEPGTASRHGARPTSTTATRTTTAATPSSTWSPARPTSATSRR